MIATNPATAPDAAPTTLGFPVCAHDIKTHVTAAIPVAVFVTVHALTVMPSTITSLPALKPNHPNQSIEAPRTTNGILCGSIGTLPYPSLLPRTKAPANAANPEEMCTTVPPAKSNAYDGDKSGSRSIEPPPM